MHEHRGNLGAPNLNLEFVIGIPAIGDHMLGSDNGRYRTEDPFTVDFRIEKEFAASSNASFTFGLDVFNALNERTVLAREPTLTGGTADNVQDLIAPRVWKLGVRVAWR